MVNTPFKDAVNVFIRARVQALVYTRTRRTLKVSELMHASRIQLQLHSSGEPFGLLLRMVDATHVR